MEKYYLSHEVGLEPSIENCNCIIKCNDNIKHGNTIKINNENFCLHIELDVTEDILNMERINAKIDNVDLVFEVVDFHDEKTTITIFRKTIK